MRSFAGRLFVSGALGLLAVACGHPDDAKTGAPPPVVPGTSDTTHAIESGTYYVDSVRDLQDGCAKRPMDGASPLTQVPFTLTNDGNSNVTLDFCTDDGTSVHGPVRDNQGTLAVIHQGRSVGRGANPAVFDQECRIELKVSADNELQGRYAETQRNRNEAMRLATVDVPDCTTSFTFTMGKHQ